MVFLIGIATAVVTFLGGWFALRFKDRLHLILGFSAGAVIGVAFFDLLPEAIEVGKNFYAISVITSVVAAGFVLYMILDRLFSITLGSEGTHRGHLGAGSLTIHSFLDGIAIGFAFQVSAAVGAIVAAAVLVHDFSDGINTVNLSLVGNGKDYLAERWLIADALAPLAGIGVTKLITLPIGYLSFVLALFTGFFLYIGASELLPESHHRHPRFWTSAATVIGIAVMYAAVTLAGF